MNLPKKKKYTILRFSLFLMNSGGSDTFNFFTTLSKRLQQVFFISNFRFFVLFQYLIKLAVMWTLLMWLTVTVTVLSFGDRRKLLKIKLHNGISKKTRILFGVTFRNINYIRFKNNRLDLTVIKTVNGGNRTVVSQAVFAAGDTESGDTLFVVENVESLGAGCRRETGDDIDVSGATDFHLETVFERAAFDEVFVDLRFVEAADDRPDGFGRRVDSLSE